jgi:ubiquinone/menaquinone biosynthesis C-methylase UbiE
MSHDTSVMRAVLSGERPTNEHFRAYYRSFHEQYEGATERAMREFHDESGQTSYERLVNALHLAPRARVLDLGCGNGPLLEEINARYADARLFGLDLSEEELIRARSRLPQDATLVEGRAEAMPFADGSFDVVTSHMVMMLLPDLNAALLEVRRVLAPDGEFVFLLSRPPDDPKDPLRELLGQTFAWIREAHATFAPVNPGDPRAYDLAALEATLLDAELTPKNVIDFSVHADLDAEGLWLQFERRYYLGSLPELTRGLLRERLTAWIGDRSMTFSEPLRIVAASWNQPLTC